MFAFITSDVHTWRPNAAVQYCF